MYFFKVLAFFCLITSTFFSFCLGGLHSMAVLRKGKTEILGWGALECPDATSPLHWVDESDKGYFDYLKLLLNDKDNLTGCLMFCSKEECKSKFMDHLRRRKKKTITFLF